MHHSGVELSWVTNTLRSTTFSTYAPQWNGTTDQHTAQYNSFYLHTTVDWNHPDWPTHCLVVVQLFLPMHHSGLESLTNTLPSTTLSAYAPQWTGTTDQHTAQYNSFYLCTTVDRNHWPTHCPVQLFLPMHHSGQEPLTNALPNTTLSSHAPQWVGLAWQWCNPHWLTDQLQVTDSINSNLFF